MSGDDDEPGRTVACRPFMHGGERAEAKLEGLIQRVHRVVLFTTEAIALLVREDVETGVASHNMLRLGDHGLVNSMFCGVVDGKSSDGAKHPENHAVQQRVRDAHFRIHGSTMPLVPGKGMGQAISLEAQAYTKLVKTSLKTHFVQRMRRNDASEYVQVMPGSGIGALCFRGRLVSTFCVMLIC